MLRKFVLGCGLVMAAVSAWLFTRGMWAPGLQVLFIAAAILLGTWFEKWRYRKGAGPHGAQWQHTDEKFADPISGEEMEVQYDPVSGERRYVRR